LSPYLPSAERPRAGPLIGVVLAAAVLYFAKEVLLPLALAILLAFALAPLVERLERWRLGRAGATLVVAAGVLAIAASVGTIAGIQAVSLAAKLPDYRHTIVEKIHALRAPRHGSTMGKAAKALKDIEKEAQPEEPLPVKETPASAFEALARLAAPLVKPLAMALAVIVFTILMLLHRENMRERVLALVGAGRLHVTTRAMAEASTRVSRYLGMLMVVNTCFGLCFGIALYLIGIPNALLFGLLGMLLRFVPYVGVWAAASMPVLLAFAIGEGWSMALWTIGVFLVLELLLAYVVEPWLYGKSVGLAPIAIIAAVLFWTWLWGPVGLLLATPLTVCAAVVGRHIPELGYLNVVLGVEPVLSPPQRFYQRLIALDYEEAAEAIEQHVAGHGVANTFEEVVIPALSLAEADRNQGALEPARERFVFENVSRIVEEIEQEPATARPAPPVCIVAAHDDADRVAAQMLARLLPPGQASVVGAPPAAAEIVQLVGQKQCRTIVISAVPPGAAHFAGHLARRLRRQLPDVRIAVGLWSAHEDQPRAREKLLKLGANDVITRLSQALELLRG
jgi:predicted PurR-regulated permease PerM/CheY-like chemotaxis protein